MYLSVIDVEPIADYKLKLTFENNEIRIYDVKPFLKNGNLKALKDKKLFNTVRVTFDTIEWSNKADLDPEILYTDSLPA